MRQFISRVTTAALLGGALIAAGCQGQQNTQTAQARPTQPAAQQQTAPAAAGEFGTTASFAYPTGNRDSSLLFIESSAPSEVRVGQPFDYEIDVTNIANHTLRDVRIIDHGTQNMRVLNATPTADTGADGRASWTFASLSPGQTESIAVTAEAQQSGQIVYCLTAEYAPFVCVATNVIQPELQLVKESPSETLLCEPIEYVLSVTNTGVGPARNVRIVDELPAGMRTASGRETVEIDVGTLEEGQTRRYQVNVQANETGQFTNEARVTADDGLRASADSSIMVRQPVLRITKTAPEYDYIGVPIRYRIEVENIGDAPARDAVLIEQIPSGAAFVNASEGAQRSGDQVTWQLGTIQPGETRSARIAMEGQQQGVLRNVSRATAYCAEDVTASAETELRGIPALLLEVVDSPDPVRVGTETTYTITVTNQGSQTATNVTVMGELEQEVEFVSAQGPAAHRLQDNRIIFEPLREIPVGAEATFTITIRGMSSGDTRFFLEMTSDSLNRPVRETESTHIYE